MHPDLFHIGPITIHTYGVLVAAGFFLAIALAMRQAGKEGVSPDAIVDIGFYVLLSGIIGSRLFFILVNLNHYMRNPAEVFKIWEGGLIFYGGVLFALPTAIWIMKKRGLDIWKTGDLFAPSLAIGHAIGRLGCFAAGCCHGKVALSLPWAVTFADPKSLALIGMPLHPTQLYESAGEFVNFIILIFLRRHKSFNGQLFLTYILLYSVLRFFVEFFRGDTVRGFVSGNFSMAQAISMLLFAGAVSGLVILRNRKNRN